MEEKLLNLNYRQQLIDEIKGSENNDRMEQSLRDCDVFKGNIHPYVKQELLDRFPDEVVREIPIVSSVNILKKTAVSKAGLYRDEPKRVFTNLNDSQTEAVRLVYKDMRVNAKMLESNRFFEVQKQNHIQIIPKNGKLFMRTLKSHQINVVPSDINPEEGEIYILSSYDKADSTIKVDNGDGQNQKIGDEDDYMTAKERFVVWSKSYHFVMDGFGQILTESIDNPIAPIIPIVEVSRDKDFTYWQDGASEISDFTVFFNSSLSMLQQISEMQGFAQAYLKAPKDLMPSYISIGPNRILKLVTDPEMDQNGSSVEFGYANPQSDVGASQAYLESLLAMFLSSQGLETSSISGKTDSNKNFSSGVERLLSMIDKFEASKDVMDIYKTVEESIWKVVKAWLNLNADILDRKYQTTEIPETAELIISYEKPESITTEKEKIDVIEKKIDLGLMSRTDAIMELDSIGEADAKEKISRIDSEETQGTQSFQAQNPANNQP